VLRHILLCFDETEASQRALGRAVQLAEAVGGLADVTVFHVLPRVPPAYLEHGGGDTPEEEAAKRERLARRREQWIAEKRDETQPVLDAAAARLRLAGVPEARIHQTYHAPDQVDDSVAKAATALARERGCDVVVAGREAWPWYREAFQRHVAEELVERADGFAVEVVD